MTRRALISCVVTCIVGALLGGTSADAAPAGGGPPAELYNKTIAIAFGVDFLATDDRGQIRQVHWDVGRLIYISTAGRVFERVSRRGGKGAKGEDLLSSQRTNTEGGQRQGRFVGNQLIATITFVSGASQMTATFDTGFRGCSANVVFGREQGTAMRRKGLDGREYQISDVRLTSRSCAVQEGNLLAGQ